MDEILKELPLSGELKKIKLLTLIKKEAKFLPVQDIMRATAFLRKDAQYMPADYRDEYIQRFSKAFFARIRDLKNDEGQYEGTIDKVKLQGFLEVLERQKEEAEDKDELCFLKIARLISIYTTFILEESIHPVGTKFPGGFVLKYQDGKYICPVKDKQLNNPSALCRFCVSIQDENV